MGTPQAATGIWVRWPGGKVTETELPTQLKEVEAQIGGRLKKNQ
jgi:hypothetical protein